MSGNKKEEIVKKVLEAFPEPERKFYFNFKRIEGPENVYLTIKPDGFLGAEVFARLKAKMNELGGEYVSAGKLSHFRIVLEPREQTLEDWYRELNLKNKPMPLPLALNLNINVTDVTQLEKILQLLKKYVIPERGGRK